MSDARPPLVSVVVPVCNGERFVDRALGSIRGQTFPDWEAVVVDDGSRDGSVAAVERHAAADARVRLVRHPANRGVSAARNTALRHARGEWVAYLDQDDEYYPDHLRRVAEWRAAGDLLVFDYDVVEDRDGHPQKGHVRRYYPAWNARSLATGNVAVPLGVAHARTLVAACGGFDEGLPRAQTQTEDVDLWRRFVAHGAKVLFVPHPSGRYYVRNGSLSRQLPG